MLTLSRILYMGSGLWFCVDVVCVTVHIFPLHAVTPQGEFLKMGMCLAVHV
jgi:hypothetical protein